jgi:hypothetical protein
MDESDPQPRMPWLLAGLAAAGAAAAGLAMLAAGGAREEAARARIEIAAASKAADRAREASERTAKEVADLRGEFEMLATNLDAVQRNIKELADKVNFGAEGGNPLGSTPGMDRDGGDAPPAQPAMEFTPELRESLRKAVEAKGVILAEDRVSIPGRVVLRQGPLELFAVFRGGRAHESVLALTGKVDADGAPAEGLGAALNSSLMALGLRPGTPIQILPGGKVRAAKGTPVHLAVEWEEAGKTVRVRAEDLLWDRERNRSMEEGRFIYVGSYFQGGMYAPDEAGDAVAVYSVASCVVDLDDPRAANDTIFMACGPRIPAEGTAVRLVFSPKPLEPTRTFDPADPEKRTDGGGGGGGK